MGLTGAILLSAAAAWLLPAWDHRLLASGVFLGWKPGFPLPKSFREYGEIFRQNILPYHREGLEAGVSVRDSPNGERTLLINGKPDASSRGDMANQALLGYLPGLLHPGHAGARSFLGILNFRQGKTEEAIRHFELFLKNSPNDHAGLSNLGIAYLRMGRLPEAKAAFLKALAQPGLSPAQRETIYSALRAIP